MRLAVISFTRAGSRLCVNLVKKLREWGEECSGYVQPRFIEELERLEELHKAGGKKVSAAQEDERAAEEMGILGIYPTEESVGAWTGKWFGQMDGLIYIGAAGIGVRAVAPFLQDKMTDPAVVVVDEQGRYAISLLSGHVGGANELTRMISKACGAEPVITTATDVNGKTAIDSWAVKHGFWIGDRMLAKEISAMVLEEKPVGFFSDYSLKTPAPGEYVSGVVCERNVWVTARKRPEPGEDIWQAIKENRGVLRLVPPVLTVGIGCRKGICSSQIEELVKRVLAEGGLEEHAVARFASIDRKREEEGICRLAQEWKVPFVTFSAEELEQVKDSVEESAFVRQVTGTGNVCERAALLGAGGGVLRIRKHAEQGVTVAVAERRTGRWQRW